MQKRTREGDSIENNKSAACRGTSTAGGVLKLAGISQSRAIAAYQLALFAIHQR